jgi:hypothetical protein
MAKFPLSGPVLIILLVVCALNASSALWRYSHWPILADDEWTQLEHDFAHAKDVLNALPERRIEYRTEEASNTYDAAAYYRLQSILAPTILQRSGVKTTYLLVEFWATKQVKPLPGLMLVEDFGHGLALFRRP